LSDNIFDLVNEEYSHLGSEISTPRDDHRRIIEKKIMEEILLQNNDGISHKNLAKSIGIDRKTLRNYTKPLIEKKFIVRENTKQGKYYASTRLHSRKDLIADLIVKAYLRNIFINSDFVIASPYFRSNEKSFRYKLEADSSVDNALFNFSNKIGAIITYTIIESMNPDNRIAPSNINNNKIINYSLERWLDDAISTLIPVLQPLFKDYIAEYLNCLTNKAIKNRSPEDTDEDELTVFVEYLVKSSNILDKECITELHSAFFGIYPNLKYPLDKIREKIPNWLQKLTEDEKKYLEKKEQQKKCSHNYVKWHNPFKVKEDFKCNKCGKFKYP
jgi:predicted transcriptional regulator